MFDRIKDYKQTRCLFFWCYYYTTEEYLHFSNLKNIIFQKTVGKSKQKK